LRERSALLLVALLLFGGRVDAQLRERPVPFDSAGHLDVITPPLAARLGLAAPVWPVSGDYLDARLYTLDDSSRSFVLVVRRQREVLERYPLTASQRGELAAAIAHGAEWARTTAGADASPIVVSEPVRGTFVVNQTFLGGILFGPAAATIVADPAGSTAIYLAVFGGTFFYAADLTRTSSVSRAQNHLSWHSARRGAGIANAALFALAGDGVSDKAYAAATLIGGIAGDVVGFQLGKPMTDAEAHGTSHGSTVAGVLSAGLLGTGGVFTDRGPARVGAALTVGAVALGYPLGLRYVRDASYRVTAGDVGTLVPSELLGMSAAAAFLPKHAADQAVFGALTAGFALGALLGDQLLVRPFDHTEAESRLFSVGTGAGALIGLAIPVLASTSDSHAIFGAMTIGGLLGAALTESLIMPRRAGTELGLGAREGVESARTASRVGVRFSPESVLMLGLGQPGRYSLLSLVF
jgi:hypothetical protein